MTCSHTWAGATSSKFFCIVHRLRQCSTFARTPGSATCKGPCSTSHWYIVHQVTVMWLDLYPSSLIYHWCDTCIVSGVWSLDRFCFVHYAFHSHTSFIVSFNVKVNFTLQSFFHTIFLLYYIIIVAVPMSFKLSICFASVTWEQYILPSQHSYWKWMCTNKL